MSRSGDVAGPPGEGIVGGDSAVVERDCYAWEVDV